MNDRDFEPLIEGALLANNGHPIFAKALTHGARVVRLPERFAEQHDHLRQAQNLVIAHHTNYEQSSLARNFPIKHYVYFTSHKRSVRISVTGQVLGSFNDIPASPSFSIGAKRYELVDE